MAETVDMEMLLITGKKQFSNLLSELCWLNKTNYWCIRKVILNEGRQLVIFGFFLDAKYSVQ